MYVRAEIRIRWQLADIGLFTVDPWFNFRATKYLVANGFYKFWDWFDDREQSSPPAHEKM
jgi:asparagine N-glycosylation enzyme membrane subunit Stt3